MVKSELVWARAIGQQSELCLAQGTCIIPCALTGMILEHQARSNPECNPTPPLRPQESVNLKKVTINLLLKEYQLYYE